MLQVVHRPRAGRQVVGHVPPACASDHGRGIRFGAGRPVLVPVRTADEYRGTPVFGQIADPLRNGGQPLAAHAEELARRCLPAGKLAHRFDRVEHFLYRLGFEHEYPDAQRLQTVDQLLGVPPGGEHQVRFEGDDLLQAHGREVADFLYRLRFRGIVAVVRDADDRTPRADGEKQFGVARDEGNDPLRRIADDKRGTGDVRYARLAGARPGRECEKEENE